MKRTVQMKNAGIPDENKKAKFKGFRKKQPTYGPMMRVQTRSTVGGDKGSSGDSSKYGTG